MTRIHRASVACLALTALFLGAQTASAQFTNGGFETGTFSGWSTVGDNFIEGSSLGTGPVEGLHDALLASATDGSVNPDVPAGQGVGASTLESLLGVNSGTLLGIGNGVPVLGSAITQTLTVQSGQQVQMDWDMLTNQVYNDGTSDSYAPTTANNDFVFATVVPTGNPNGAFVVKLADTFYGYVDDPNAPGGFITGFTLTPASNPFISETGFQTFSWTASATGSYTIGIGVLHVTNGPDDGINSAILVDNARLSAVPEPASLVGLGMLSLGVALRRRTKRGAR
ncbi:MAG TPA: PEP-CTERM sorting domain-containing protein [Fimbriimonadaceae bacterium]|nr:PEP-CTERM sorting domain-containing protein [Fimbriimonadaceae bacterium]